MMKKWVLAVLLCTLVCMGGAAYALELPGIAVFSPGLKRLAELEKTQPLVLATAQVAVDKAMYARDLSLLGDMLDGTTISYQRSDAGESVVLHRGGEELGAYALGEELLPSALEEKLLGVAVLERVPLGSIADWLESLVSGDALAFGYAVQDPFVIERTMSDDGTRLTKIKVDGSIAREGEMPWRVSGYLRQPAGRAPKDTFELTFAQDEENSIELLYSALRENEMTRKDREGTMSVRTTLKAAGKIGGYGISSRLSVTTKNKWTSDGEKLSERVTISASLGHTDRTPGRRMQRLNDIAAETKHVIRLTTDAADAPIELDDEITLDVTMDSNTFLAGSASLQMCIGGEEKMPAQNLRAMDEASAKALAEKLYRTLDEKTKNTLEAGL